MSYTLLINLDLVSRMSEFKPVLFLFGFFKRQVTSAVTGSQPIS